MVRLEREENRNFWEEKTMNCKDCKNCKQHVSKITLAYGGCTYVCEKRGCVVGDYDAINKKHHWKGYEKAVSGCHDFEEKETKRIVFSKREETEYRFLLENDDFHIMGGDRSTALLEDKTWVGILNKKDKGYGQIYYLDDLEYKGFVTEELEDRIISMCLNHKNNI